MQADQVRAAIEAVPAGANIIVEWVRPVKVKKSCQDKITKSVKAVGRMKIDYDNLKSVQAKRESGELPAENAGLPWGFWVSPCVIGMNKGLKKEDPLYSTVLPSTEFYLRLYNGTSDKVRPEVHFFRNGVEVSKESIDGDILASEKDSEHGDCFTCKFENMTRIHSESEWLMIVVGEVGQERIAVAAPVPAKVLATMQN